MGFWERNPRSSPPTSRHLPPSNYNPRPDLTACCFPLQQSLSSPREVQEGEGKSSEGRIFSWGPRARVQSHRPSRVAPKVFWGMDLTGVCCCFDGFASIIELLIGGQPPRLSRVPGPAPPGTRWRAPLQHPLSSPTRSLSILISRITSESLCSEHKSSSPLYWGIVFLVFFLVVVLRVCFLCTSCLCLCTALRTTGLVVLDTADSFFL